MIEIELNKISDPIVKEFAQRVKEEFKNQVLLRGKWRFVTLSFATNVTNFKFPHNLGFKPLDLIQTSKVGTGTLTWNYSRFDSVNLDITTSGTSASDILIVRAFVGTYVEGGIV